jgi:hypothetical protein
MLGDAPCQRAGQAVENADSQPALSSDSASIAAIDTRCRKRRTERRSAAVVTMMTRHIVPIVSSNRGQIAGAVADDPDRIIGQKHGRQVRLPAGTVDQARRCDPRVFHNGQSRLEGQEAEQMTFQSGPPDAR